MCNPYQHSSWIFSGRASLGTFPSATLAFFFVVVLLFGPTAASAQQQPEARPAKPKIAVFSGATATVANTEPLVTSNKARAKYGLPLRTKPDGSLVRFDVLRPQRLARPVTVYVEQFSAHPLEGDAAEVYAPPDGYLDAQGVFHLTRNSPSDVPVYEVTLEPDDGLYLFPYMARQANGQAWNDDCTRPRAPKEECRQPFYPDASRLFEEIDRFGLGTDGFPNLLSSKAAFDFYRPAPSGGYTRGLAEGRRTDVGEGSIAPERLGEDFFPYRPTWLFQTPPREILARVTNVVARVLGTGRYSGALWLEGSPHIEETIYWLNLLIDTHAPIVANASQRPHGALSNDGDQNIVDAVDYIVSRVWADDDGRDRVGAVAIQEKQIFAAREVQKGDARPGGYVAAGGHGGIIGRISEEFTPTVLTFAPVRRHTHTSAVSLPLLPRQVTGVRMGSGRIAEVSVPIKDERGDLLPSAIPQVTIVKGALRYSADAAHDDPTRAVDVLAWIGKYLQDAPLAGFVGEGTAPYGGLGEDVDGALRRAVYTGMPVVRVGRGNAEGFTPAVAPFISGSNLTATKARLLLMACLLKFGSLPVAADPTNPTRQEIDATMAKVARYQQVFDTH